MKNIIAYKILIWVLGIAGVVILLWANWKILIGVFFLQLSNIISRKILKEKNKRSFGKIYDNILQFAKEK